MVTFQLKTLIVPLQFNRVVVKHEFLSVAPLTRFIAQSDGLIQINGGGVFGGAAVGLAVILAAGFGHIDLTRGSFLGIQRRIVAARSTRAVLFGGCGAGRCGRLTGGAAGFG